MPTQLCEKIRSPDDIEPGTLEAFRAEGFSIIGGASTLEQIKKSITVGKPDFDANREHKPLSHI